MRLPGFSYNPRKKVARFDVSVTDGSGRRHRHRKTETHETRADALKAWGAFRDRVRAGRGARKAWTLRTYWEAKRKGFSAIMSTSRFSNVAGIVETRLLPVLGDTHLEKIHGPAVLDLLGRMGREGLQRSARRRKPEASGLRAVHVAQHGLRSEDARS
jgi:hypothetical protein